MSDVVMATGLRQGAVRRMAGVVCADRHNPSIEGRYCGACAWDAARSLDALVDCLREQTDSHADKWNWPIGDRIIVAGLLGLLHPPSPSRETPDGGEDI